MPRTIICILAFVISMVNCWPNFYLYNSQSSGKMVQPSQLIEMRKKGCNCLNEVFFIIHGFNAGVPSSQWMHDMKSALLARANIAASVILVDWEVGSNPAGFNVLQSKAKYEAAQKNVTVNGQRIAKFIKDSGLSPGSIHCIGHSLGAHSCGFTAKHLGAKLKRISGLDPAGPKFRGEPVAHRLDATDALFVDVIHTDICLFGNADALGHLDFYVNGGRAQPGCPGMKSRCTGWYLADRKKRGADKLACNHGKACDYYIDSIYDPYGMPFRAWRAVSYEHFDKGQYEYKLAYMGFGATKEFNSEGPVTTRGKMYLNYTKK